MITRRRGFLAPEDLDAMMIVPGDLAPEYDPFLDALSILDEPEARLDAYPSDMETFIAEVIGDDLWEGQKRIVRSVEEHRRTSVASCHGIGKSRLIADLVIAWLHTRENSIVLSTAPTGRQVENVLWREIRAAYKRARMPLLGRPPLTLKYDISELWYAIGFKPKDGDTSPAQGFHSEYALVLIDEAAGVPEDLIKGLSAALTSEECRLLLTGNPTSTAGTFYESHHGASSLYHPITIPWTETPNYLAKKTVRPYLITQQWVDDSIEENGINSAYVQSRVYARFQSASDALIPLAAVMAATEDERKQELPHTAPYEAGLDVSRGGDGDRTVLVIRGGPRILSVIDHPTGGGDIFDVTGWALRECEASGYPVKTIKVDRSGLGEGVNDNLRAECRRRKNGIKVIGVNAGSKSHDPEKYGNQRQEMWNLIADRFRKGEIAGDIGALLRGDLSDIRAKDDGRHTQPVVEPKEAFKKRQGRSPDHGDALCLAFYTPPREDDVTPGILSFGRAKQTWGHT